MSVGRMPLGRIPVGVGEAGDELGAVGAPLAVGVPAGELPLGR
jgi:hypothetical protein